jgi:hypothetical protein
MFELERFRRQLGETIAWCTPRLSMDDLKNSLRNVLPKEVHDLCDYDLTMKLVDSAVTIRRALLEARYHKGSFRQEMPPLPIGLENGRLLVFYPGRAVYDPASGIETKGYFNSITIPACDTWVYSGIENVTSGKMRVGIEYLLCWIPPQLLQIVQDAIEGDPTECIEWLDETVISLSFLKTLKTEGYLKKHHGHSVNQVK